MLEILFNMHAGYLEGLVRGFKSGILRQADYLNLVQCETLEGELFSRGAELPSTKSHWWNILDSSSSSSMALIQPVFHLLQKYLIN